MTKLNKKKLIILIKTIENNSLELNEKNLKVLLFNYKATLSLIDQKIFFLFQLFNDKGFQININDFINFDFDKPNSNNKKITNSTITLFMNKFNKNIFKETIFSSPSNICFSKLCEFNSKIYDLRFFILSFNQIINLREFNLENFIDLNCFALVLTSLSLESSILREVAYVILFKLEKYCHTSYGKIWKIYLELIKASITCRNERLSNLITSFLIYLIPFLKNPIYSNHEKLINFFTKKPILDERELMFFLYNMLKIDEEPDSFYQNIALLILKNGIKSEKDYILCKNYKIINLLLSSYNSSIIINKNLKIKLLEVFEKIICINSAVQDLCDENAFFLWLNQIILDDFDNIDILSKLEKINQILLKIFKHTGSFKKIYINELNILKRICTRKLDYYFECNE